MEEMEVERVSSRESSKNPPLPAEFWSIMHKSVFELLNNGKNIVPQLDQIIQPCKNHHEYYVPPKLGQQAEYEAKLPHYIGFTTWLLAQIVRATTADELECHHQQLVDWQITIIELLAYRNQFMFSVVLSEYLAAIKDLVAARKGKEGPLEFVWFHRANVDSQPALKKFTLRNNAACGALLCHLLKVVRTHTRMLAACDPSDMSDYWAALLALLGDSDEQVWLATLDSVTANIKCNGFPSESYVAYSLCESLKARMSGPGCPISGWSEGVLDSTNAFFEAVLAHHGAADRKALSCLYLGLVALLVPHSSVLCSGTTSRGYCKLITLLSRECPDSVDIKKKVLTLLDHAARSPDILLIVESLVWNDLQALPDTPENTRMCEDVSSLWKSVVGMASKTVETLASGGQAADTVRQLTRLLSAVALTAANISLRLHQSSTAVLFFRNSFYQNWNKLLREIDLNVIYLEVAKTSKYLTSLRDMSVIDLKEANSLLAFLSIPWLNCMITATLPQVDLAPYNDMADLELFLDDPTVNGQCLEGLMVMECGSLSLEWRLAVASQAAKGMDEVALLDLVCAMLTTLPLETRPRIVTTLVDPFFATDHNVMLPQLAKKFPTVVCTLAGTTELVRSTSAGKYESDLFVRCKVCDGDNSQDSKFIEDGLAVATLEKYLQLRFNKCLELRKYMAASLRRWSKHIPEPFLRQHVDKWLRYIKEESHEVRMAMADNAGHLVSAHSTESFIGLYRQVMLTLIHNSLSPSDCHLQLSLMITASNVGSQPFDNVLLPTLEMFVPFVCHPMSLLDLQALVYLNKIATARGKTVQDLFFKFQDEIFKYFALLLIINYLENAEHATTMMVKLARAFSFADTKELWDLSGCKYLLKHLLPHITKNPKAKNLLVPIAVTAGTDVTSILKDSFAYVYAHVLLFEDKATQDSVHQLIENLTQLSTQSLICFSFKVVICELLLYYHMEKTKVTEALRSLRDCDYGAVSTSENLIFTNTNKPDSPNNDITQFLQPRFLAVLAYLDSILVTQSCCESTKRHALLTLPELIRLMGVQHITPVRFKVLATLRYALNLYHSYFPQLICFAWRAFVQNVSSLGPLLSAIFVSLLPLLDQYPVEICSVFRILVVDNLEAVRDFLAELYFLPDTPPTHQIYQLVQQELEKLRRLPVKDQLAVTLRLATHENADVRLRGLHKLRGDLALHRENLVPLISAHDNIDPFILKLLEALLSGCQDPDAEVRLASAQCLGELGALDPGRLPNKFKIEVEEKEMFVINSEAFVLRALNEFVRAFQAASHTTTMDVFAFGIQELLKMYKVPQSPVWDQLSDATKEIISPFRESRYARFTDTTDSHPHIPHPIFGTNFGSSLKLWAWNWVSRLIPSVTDEFVRKVFSVCLLGLKKDLQSLLFFFPYIVLHAILGATKSQSRRIGEEISAVLFHRGDDQPTLDTPRSIPSSGSLQSTQATHDEVHTHSLCAKTVYQLLDFLYHWLRQTKQQLNPGPNGDPTLAQQYNTLREFLMTFSKKDIAVGSFSCKEYTRALLFLEEYMSENPDLVQSYLPDLGKIYYHLHDPDSFKGIFAIREEEPTAQETILCHKLTGKLQDAAACYERLVQLQGCSPCEAEDFYKGMVQCYLGMDQPSTALQLTRGFLNNVDKWGQCGDMVDEQAEALLALSRFPELEQLLSASGTTATASGEGWGTALGRALLHLSHGSEAEMVAGLDHIRRALVRNLAGCSLTKSATGYRQGYDVVVKLHILSELEKVGQMVFKMQGRPLQEIESMFKQVVQKELDERLKVVQPSYRVLQPVLGVRRVVLSLARDIAPQVQSLFTTEIGNSWLKSIEIARKSGHFQQAYTNILTVEPFKPKGLFVEKARLLWAKSEPEAALNTLKRGVERNFPNVEPLRQSSSGNLLCSGSDNLQMDERRLCAEAYLLIAQYNDENANIDMDTNIKNYKKAVAICPQWEKSCVCLAQCYYKYLRSTTLLTHQLDCQIHLVNMFGKSLQYGCEFIYQSMPRMLSIWLDFGTQLAQDMMKPRAAEGLTERKSAMDKMTGLIEAFSKRLPTYMFMTAFSQIISRICHPQKGCYNILKAIIIKIIIAYPQQALWMFLSVYKSPYTVRVRRCEEVLKSSEILKRPELNHTITAFQELFNRLIEFSAKKGEGKAKILNLRTFLPSLYSLVSNPGFGRVVIPLQRFRTISLPRTPAEHHNPFPEDLVYISGIKEEVAIVSSLQSPKRISFIGTDGKQYSLLCKPNDDMRLDSRMMEFSSIVNMYLRRDPEARDRGLYIRTYSAVPLSDTSGIIEWVPDLIGLRQILNTAYKQMGVAMPHKELQEYCRRLVAEKSLVKKRAMFLEKLMPCHPPVLREWYLREFSHPTAWYLARTAFVRTLAVMSIVGFMLGLGDRHGENMLIDATCGDVFHVDFNCLFKRGERFDVPEKVPFRLTHNLTHAMGPTGVEGLFRHSCEITARVMRQQIDQLMSVVRPFCYDPLVSWNKNNRDENAEMTNEKAMEDIQNIEMQLQGIVKTKSGSYSVPLSVEGQVRILIMEATDINNLCQMYPGWGPFL